MAPWTETIGTWCPACRSASHQHTVCRWLVSARVPSTSRTAARVLMGPLPGLRAGVVGSGGLEDLGDRAHEVVQVLRRARGDEGVTGAGAPHDGLVHPGLGARVADVGPQGRIGGQRLV